MSNPTHDELVEDIQATREQLGATVEELAHRLDVKAQVDEKVAETKEAVHAKVDQTKETVVAKVTDVKETVAAKVGDVKETVTAKVGDVKAKVASDKPAAAEPPAPAAPPIPTIPAQAGTAGRPGIREWAMEAANRPDIRLSALGAALAGVLAAILLRRS
jgi:hypothetical protein